MHYCPYCRIPYNSEGHLRVHIDKRHTTFNPQPAMGDDEVLWIGWTDSAGGSFTLKTTIRGGRSLWKIMITDPSITAMSSWDQDTRIRQRWNRP